jgi:hypothetical protein
VQHISLKPAGVYSSSLEGKQFLTRTIHMPCYSLCISLAGGWEVMYFLGEWPYFYIFFFLLWLWRKRNSVPKSYRKNLTVTKDVKWIIWSCSFQQETSLKFEEKLHICHFQFCFYLVLVSSKINIVRWRHINLSTIHQGNT